jgi:hypothetical protein
VVRSAAAWRRWYWSRSACGHACRGHGRLVARLRGQHHQASTGTVDWQGHISGKRPGNHCRPRCRLGRSHQSKRADRWSRPARESDQGRLVPLGVDLTPLSVDQQKLPVSLRMRRMPLCEKPPWTGEPVIVAVPEGTARSRIMSPQLLPRDVRWRFPTVISDVATTGNSGSGVSMPDAMFARHHEPKNLCAPE